MSGERERLAQHDPHNTRGVGELLDPSTFNLENEVPAAMAAGNRWMIHFADQAGLGDPVALPEGPDSHSSLLQAPPT